MTIASTSGGLGSVTHGVSLTGAGTGASPLNVAVPLSLSGTSANVLSVTSSTDTALYISGGAGGFGLSATGGLGGVYGHGTNTYGVEGDTVSAVGVYGLSSGIGNGIYGSSVGGDGGHFVGGTGTYGASGTGGAGGLYGHATAGDGVDGDTSTGIGVWGYSGGSGIGVSATSQNGYGLYASSGGSEAGHFAGNVGVTGSIRFGAATRQLLSLYDNGTYQYGIGVQTSTLYQRAGTGGGFAWYSGGSHNDAQFNAGTLGGVPGVTLMTLNGAGTLAVHVLTIVGGSDVAEPFPMSEEDIPKGTVMVIDDEHAGKLKPSARSYDTRVAGIVSGAGGVNPGITLHQEGVLEGGQNVALSGRVYVLADTSGGAIRPGDLLTTSDAPGHAMKASDPGRAHGAIIGKAMGTLEHGSGTLLVLVTLQ